MPFRRGAEDCKKHPDRKSTRLNSSHSQISYAVFCLKKKKTVDLYHNRAVRRHVDRLLEDHAPLLLFDRVGAGAFFVDGLAHVGFFFFNDTATTEIYTLSLHDALPISDHVVELVETVDVQPRAAGRRHHAARSEEHTSELQSQSNLVCRLLLEKKK